jgi:DNA transformation protein
MFGGAGIWYETVMFALIFDDRLFFKGGAANRQDFEAEDCEPFVYELRNGRRGTMSYWEVPERLFDEPEELRAWADKAIQAALAARKPTPKKRAKAKPSRKVATKAQVRAKTDPKAKADAGAKRGPRRSRP